MPPWPFRYPPSGRSSPDSESSTALIKHDHISSSSDASSDDDRSDSHDLHRSYYHPAYRPHTPRRPARLLLILASCQLIGNVTYLASLTGADTPKQMSGMLGRLGALIGLTVVLFSAQFWLASLSRHTSTRTRWLSHTSQLLNILAWVAYDHGNSLDQHGSYNLLIFNLILIPSNAVAAFLIFWYRLAAGADEPKRPRRFWIQFCGSSVLFLFVVLACARSKERALHYGFFGNEIPLESAEGVEMGVCQWERATPWFDLIPFRLNFFTGPMTCSAENSFDASLSTDGVLKIDCRAQTTVVKSDFDGRILGEYPGAAFSILPRTESWGLRLKNDSLTGSRNELQRNVVEYAEAHTQTYEGLTRLDDDVETVIARCGDAQPKIVYRIASPHKDGPQVVEDQNNVTSQRLSHPQKDGLNVVTLFIDAVSRPMFHRRLPETRIVLEQLASRGGIEGANATLLELFRYHTVGMNTRPNTRALWAGLSSPGENAPADMSEEFRAPIWEEFEANGYTAARIDPMCQDWATYYDTGHVRLNGSNENFAPRISHEHVAWSCFPPYLPLGPHFAGNFAGSTSIKARCISGTHVGWHELDWAETFIRTYSGAESNNKRAYFLNAAFMEGHEGSGEVLASLDERLAAFLDPKTGPIDYSNTAVMIVSDHGALMGLNYAFLESGKIEASNPFAAVVLPDGYLDSKGGRRELAEAAQGKLVTAFDLYEMLRGFMGDGREPKMDEPGDDGEDIPRRGYDLIREDPKDRSCDQAGVPESACKCLI